MILDSPAPKALLVVLCLLPAATRWWSGHVLLPRLDDPLLPERLLAHRRRNLTVLAGAVATIILLGGATDLFWTLPLVVIARMVAGYPLRRALFEEQWSFFAYAWTMLRLLVAVAGFWVLLITAPLIARAAGAFDWIVASALAAVLLLWNDRSTDLFRSLLRAESFKDSVVLARFEAIAAASRTPRPRFELIDLHGGAIANAIALPSQRGSSVLYTDKLLRLLDTDEAAAITAHEVAHLEHFDEARLRQLRRITSALILGGACAALLPRLLPSVPVLLLWTLAVVMTMAWIGRNKQRNETASDVRAVELCGNPDALISALTKLHAFARVPRRWDTQMERAASHPSLARRVRSIRAAAGNAEAPALRSPETVHGVGGLPAITFESDRLHWSESEGIDHVLSYAQLTELRVQARAGGRTRLVAIERGGRRWETALDADEAARTQAMLDRVDVGLADPLPRPKRAPLLQFAGLVVAICAMWVGQVAVAIVAMTASVRSAAAFVAAAGGAALGAAGIAGRQAITTGDADRTWPALLLAAFGIALLSAAWRQREDQENRLVKAGIATLALLSSLSVALVAMEGSNVVGLHQASLAMPSAAVLPLALAAALACRPRRAWRVAALPVGLVGLIVALAGSATFLHAFGRDPFLTAGVALPIETLSGSPMADFTLPGVLSDLRLSPGGRQLAVQTYALDGVAVQRFSVGAPGTKFAPIEATDLVFLDDERVLTMSVDRAGTVVREVVLQPRSVAWERRIDNLQPMHLMYRRTSQHWLLAGRSLDGGLTLIEGTIGSSDVQRRDWTVGDRLDWADASAFGGDAALLAEKRYDVGRLGAAPWLLAMALMPDRIGTRLTRVTATGTSEIVTTELETTCADRVLDAERLVCVAFDGAQTNLFDIDPADGAPSAIGSIAGRFVSYRATRDGWLSGWMNAGTWNAPTQLAIDVVSRRAVAVPRELGAHELTVVGHVAATVTHQRMATRVRLYRVP